MSLIHDALQKALDKEKAKVGDGVSAFQESEGGKLPIPKRALILGGVLVLVLGYFLYAKFFSGPSTSNTPMLPPTIQAGQITEQDTGKLKKNALNAYNADDMDTAWANLVAASRLEADSPEVWNNLGLVARKRGDAAKARESYQKALDLKPDYPECLNNMAVLEMQAGNNAKAKELLEKALKSQPAYPEANFHLALLYDQKGDKVNAVNYYKRFLDVGKNFPSSVVDSVRDRVMEIEP